MNLKIKKINVQNFSKYGQLISTKDIESKNINSNTTKSFFDLANIQILGKDKNCRINIFKAKKRNFPLEINMLEKHPFSSQVFLPLDKDPFFVIVCPASSKPDLNNLKIFKIENGNGVNFKPEVWHFHLISINDARNAYEDLLLYGDNVNLNANASGKVIFTSFRLCSLAQRTTILPVISDQS